MARSLFGLPVSSASAWIFNCYVIESADGLAVVDPGLPVVARATRTMIERELGRAMTDVDTVACTHGHHDHVAGVSTVTDGTDCTVVMPRQCESYLAGETPRTFPLIESSLRFMPVWRGQPFSTKALVEFVRLSRQVGFGGRPDLVLDFEPGGFVGDGDAMPAAPGWEAIHAPGHTDDSTCFYHADTATLLSGDAVVTHDGAAWFNPEYVDLDVAKQTEERLRSLDVRHLLPGHGQPIESSNVWRTAKSSTERPTGNGMLARCSRRFGKWPTSAQ